jgi:tRNA (guanine-N7-)-methyltransferase
MQFSVISLNYFTDTMFIDYKKYPYPHKIRHHVGTNLYFPLNEMTFTPLYYPPLYDEVDFLQIFKNNKPPSILDIGCGKGKFLIDIAELYPEDNVLGFEVRKVLVEWIQNFAEKENIENVWALWYTVVNGLSFLKENSIKKVFYLFPDPWPKKKQQNRRLFSENFLKDIYRVLTTDGKLYLATDCDYVDEHHKKTLDQSGLFNYRIAENSEWNLPLTNKETFCKKKDIPVFRIICERK